MWQEFTFDPGQQMARGFVLERSLTPTSVFAGTVDRDLRASRTSATPRSRATCADLTSTRRVARGSLTALCG